MLSVLLLSVGIPCMALAVCSGLRRKMPARAANTRGLALQTVIIMVVLLAIAGAVAAVLVARGNQAVGEIERTNITRQPSDFTSETLCTAAGFTWSSGACTSPGAPPGPPSPPVDPGAGAALTAYTVEAHCTAQQHVWSSNACTANPTKSAYTVESNCNIGGGTWDAGTSTCS